MKTPVKLVVLALLAASSLLPATLHAQGTLTPPGAPAPTMKTLDQIYAKLDPRTALSTNTTPGDASDLYIISQPGSYYLTSNIVTTGTYAGTGIEITANNVTLDLNGFSVSCTSPNTGTYGIYIPNTQTNITVRNGNVNGWFYGLFGYTGYSADLVFEKLNVVNCNKSGNGYGITVNGPAVIRDCTFEGNVTGISCNNNVSPGGSLIVGCTVNDNAFYGIECSGGGIISGCTANNNLVGIQVIFNQFGNSPSDGLLVSKCTANNNNYGIYVQGARNRVEGNHLVNNGSYGLYVAGGSGYSNNIVIGNSAAGSGTANYSISGTQITGPIITATGTITNSNPWANFSF
jgi:parallel beta-helix repeat protein